MFSPTIGTSRQPFSHQIPSSCHTSQSNNRIQPRITLPPVETGPRSSIVMPDGRRILIAIPIEPTEPPSPTSEIAVPVATLVTSTNATQASIASPIQSGTPTISSLFQFAFSRSTGNAEVAIPIASSGQDKLYSIHQASKIATRILIDEKLLTEKSEITIETAQQFELLHKQIQKEKQITQNTFFLVRIPIAIGNTLQSPWKASLPPNPQGELKDLHLETICIDVGTKGKTIQQAKEIILSETSRLLGEIGDTSTKEEYGSNNSHKIISLHYNGDEHRYTAGGSSSQVADEAHNLALMSSDDAVKVGNFAITIFVIGNLTLGAGGLAYAATVATKPR